MQAFILPVSTTRPPINTWLGQNKCLHSIELLQKYPGTHLSVSLDWQGFMSIVGMFVAEEGLNTSARTRLNYSSTSNFKNVSFYGFRRWFCYFWPVLAYVKVDLLKLWGFKQINKLPRKTNSRFSGHMTKSIRVQCFPGAKNLFIR